MKIQTPAPLTISSSGCADTWKTIPLILCICKLCAESAIASFPKYKRTGQQLLDTRIKELLACAVSAIFLLCRWRGTRRWRAARRLWRGHKGCRNFVAAVAGPAGHQFLFRLGIRNIYLRQILFIDLLCHPQHRARNLLFRFRIGGKVAHGMTEGAMYSQPSRK